MSVEFWIDYARKFGTECILESCGMTGDERALLRVELDAIEAARRNGRCRVGKRRRRPTSETVELAALLRTRGLVVGAIADKLGVSEPYVRKCLSKSRTAKNGVANTHG